MTKTLSLLPGIDSSHPQATWVLGPVGHHRDSDLVDECNWDAVTEAYLAADPEGTDHEIHRFGHFAVGWVEEVAVRPGSKCAELQDIYRASLESYPILDEERHSEMETEQIYENWPDICKEIRSKVLKHAKANWAGWESDDMEWTAGDTEALESLLDDVSEDALRDASSGLGEEREGWVKYSDHDIAAIAENLMPTLGVLGVKPECEGHPAGPSDPMGQTVYCDGSCRH